MKYTIAALVMTIMWAVGAQAQTARVFGTEHALSSSLINQLYQDRNGMMWVTTEDGICRYDGNKFTTYRNIPGDSHSLCNNFVKSLFEDEQGTLYVCSRRGIQIYDPDTDSFSERLTDASGNALQASVEAIVRRNTDEYWVVGDSIRRFSAKDHIIRHVPPLGPELRDMHCAIVDAAGNIWMSKNELGLYRVSPDDRLTRYFGTKAEPAVSSMTIGKDGLLYAGTTTGMLMRYDSDNDTFDILTPAREKEIKWLYADNNGDIVQATDGDGIIVYTPASGTQERFNFSNPDIASSQIKTHCAIRDADNNIWVALYQTGVVMLPQRPNSFGYIGHKSIATNVIGRNCVSSICRDHTGTLWVGVDNDGIYALTPTLEQSAHLSNKDINVPMCIFEDSQHNLWVGTYLHGAGMVDRKTGTTRHIDFTGVTDRPANCCFALTEDRDHNVWMGMLNSGLFRYNLDEGRLTDYSWQNRIDPWVGSLYYSPKTNSLYVGTYSGLQIVDNVSLADPQVTTLFREDVIYSIDEDPDGDIWLATTNGFLRYHPADGSSKRYNISNGLSNNTVYALRHDGRYVWAGLSSGLTRFDPATESFSNFLVDDGLQANEFYKNAVFRDHDGHLYFGGPGGVTHFNPRDITDPGRRWTPRLAGLYLHGTPARTGRSIYEASEFHLASDENSLSIEFGTRELGRPLSVLFAYSLDGKSWETLPPGSNIVNFHNLSPGRHTLAFKSIDSSTESSVRTAAIFIAAPWYASPWTKALSATAVLILLWWGARAWRIRMRQRAEVRDLMHAEQLNEARLQSFVNISHEIRTPMSLVISPLQKLLASDNDSGRRREYGLILRNAKRILRLIDELMDLRKIEKHQMKLELADTRLVPFVTDLCDTFARVSADKHIELNFNYDNAEIAAPIDSANFDKILMNLLSNAVKYTPEGGRIDINLAENDGKVELSVTDTGIGIPDADKERIFERFYQAHGNSAGGTGVGLHLTHQLVTLHNGTLTVADNPEGRGTRFTITLPAASCTATDRDTDALFPGSQPVAAGQPLSDIKSLLVPDLEEPEDMPARAAEAHLLVVEDDAEIRRYLEQELGRRYRVDSCANGGEALDMIFANAPDLILSDVMMPVINGLDLTRIIKQNINLNHIPIVLLTAMTRDEDNIKAIEAGADDYITKPFNIEVLRTKIAGLLTRYRSLKNRYSGHQEFDDKIDPIEVQSTDEKLMNRIMAVINREMANPELTVEQLASDVGLSRVHLHRRLKALTNQSPRDFIRNTRLRQAARLLAEKKLSVSEVADLTGFSNAGSFTTSFKRLYGVTPGEYAKGEVSKMQEAENQL
ncbi:MAG: response regulator [Muribaculaceae bacterium]|nr:response regulator [Muribaculaceae bacterium]